MKIKDVRKRVQAISDRAWDPEAAHNMQDQLWEDILRAIAGYNTKYPQLLAAEGLKVLDIEFPRWAA